MRSESYSDGQPIEQGRRTFIGQARRAQLIEHAISAIADMGYARASLAEIAKRAGISKGVILYHFAGKDELMEQVVVEVYTAGFGYMMPRLQAATTATEMLRTYIETNIAFIGEHRKQMMALIEIFANLRAKDGKTALGCLFRRADSGLAGRVAGPGQAGRRIQGFRDTHHGNRRIRRAIDAVPPLLAADPSLDAGIYGRELATIFELATRKDDG